MNAGAKPQSFQELLAAITPQLHRQLRTAVELGKWENGERLTAEQTEHCMQLIIGWELHNLPESERVAWIDRSGLNKRKQDGA
jgi:uncharacterized protein YeaC (DUF1315 family)